MSSAPSFFDIYFKITFFAVFTGVLLTTIIAPLNVWPGSIIFPKYVEVCLLICEMVEIPINGLWGGLINGGTYSILASAGYAVIRLIRRKKKT
jgi:hypothetical protein